MVMFSENQDGKEGTYFWWKLLKLIFPSDDNDDDECNVENVVDKHLPNPRSPSVQAYSLVGRGPPCWPPCQPPCKLSHPPPSTSSQPSSQQHRKSLSSRKSIISDLSFPLNCLIIDHPVHLAGLLVSEKGQKLAYDCIICIHVFGGAAMQ